MTGCLAGRVVLVTGSGSGIGQGIACLFAREGAIVGVNDRRSGLTAATIKLIRDAGGVADDVPADASSRTEIRAAVLDMAARHGRFDIMVNNAAWVRYEKIADISEKTLDRMVAIGFSGVVWGMQAAAEAMGTKGGAIVNIASSAAFLGMPNALVYCGIKAGVTGLTRSAANDLGPQGIRVNAVAPGSTKTEAVMGMLDDAMVAAREARAPLRRMGEVEDIAEAALFLASDRSRFVTGSVMLVDGGITNAFS